MLSGQIPYLRGKEEAGKRAKKCWLEGVWRAMKGWLQCCGRIWNYFLDPELLFRIQQKMDDKIHYFFFSNFRPMNSGLCTATEGLRCKIEDGRYLEDSSF